MRHLLAAAIYVATWAALLIQNAGDGNEALFLTAGITASIVAGLISGSWWSPLLAASLLVLAGLDECQPDERCEVNPVVLVMMIPMPVSAGLIALGVGAHRLLSGLRREAPPRPSP